MSEITTPEDDEIFKERDLDSKYKILKRKKTLSEKILSRFRCSGERCSNLVKEKLPILDWLPKYNVRKSALGDVAAGLTVGIVHIPQGLAYAQLASLPPVVGLYVSLFPVLLYPIFGTCRHLSMGTFAIVSIIVSGVLTQHIPDDYCGSRDNTSVLYYPNDQTYATTDISPTSIPNTTSPTDTNCAEIYNSRMIEVATALSVAVGLVQLLMHVFHLGVLSAFMSESMLSGFLCGAALLVITSQIPALLGFKLKRPEAPFVVVKYFVGIFQNITSTNILTLIISVLCLVFLMIGKKVNERFKKNLPVPIPWELFVVAISTLCSYFLHFNEDYDVANVGFIPTGISTSVPKIGDILDIFVDAIPVAAAAFTIEITQCYMWAAKHSYDIDSNQELLALGTCNIFGAFFCCYPSGPSLSRSAIYEEVGAKTQMGSYVSSLVVLIVLLWMGPLFQTLPLTVLACIIIVNIRRVALVFLTVPSRWKISRLDTMTWIITCVSVMTFNITTGVVVGAVFSIFTVLFFARSAEGASLKALSNGIYRNAAEYSTAPSDEDILIYQFAGPIFFGNKDRFIAQLTRHLGYDPVKLASHPNSSVCRPPANADDHEVNAPNGFDHTDDSRAVIEVSVSTTPEKISVSIAADGPVATSNYIVVIFDMSRCSFIDSDGAKCVRGLCESLQTLGITVMIVNCADVVMARLEGCWMGAPEINFISLESAVKYARIMLKRNS